MKGRTLLLLLYAVLAFPLTGCWDIKSLQDVNYFTGIGIDYENGKYRIYVQQLDFANVAKTESGKSTNPATVWIGQAEGLSMSDAVMKLYQTTQQTVFWGHLSCVILSEAVLKSGDLVSVFDNIIRSPEIRYTPWVYGTKTNIEDLFTTKPFFNLSPMNSILYAPETNYDQRPIIAPMRLYKFAREMREPGQTTFVPSLGVSDDTWMRNKKKDPKLDVDGLFVLHNDVCNGWIGENQATGLRWLVNQSPGGRILLKENDKMLATLRMNKPKSKVKIEIKKGEPVFHIDVKVDAAVYELGKQLSEKELSKLAGEAVAGEIRSTFEAGLAMNHADLFGLEHELYRKKFKTWKAMTKEGKIPLKPIVLGNIDVNVHVVHTGMFKLKRDFDPFTSK
ncbi:Ger(x)C family spore germination protein [Cohnella suwonensis]|uniref:Ger(X)C family spore germination protein n=1 Tax=Cohnella suwonensis TaxID=696072 RepID=A0ABW0LP55_9BACL